MPKSYNDFAESDVETKNFNKLDRKYYNSFNNTHSFSIYIFSCFVIPNKNYILSFT